MLHLKSIKSLMKIAYESISMGPDNLSLLASIHEVAIRKHFILPLKRKFF